MSQKFYITTPIYYVNAKPHVGHAYSTFVADALARAHRLRGNDVLFVTGTDENSQKNAEAMEAAGESNLIDYLDRMAGVWKKTWDDLDIRYDRFIRTTEPAHLAAVERFWDVTYASGAIQKGQYEGVYCVGCESFKTETEITDDRCPLHPNKSLQKIAEENYFFDLKRYKPGLLEGYQNGHFTVSKEFQNEVIGYLNNPATDRISVSRPAKSLQTGIPVPGDDSQRIYVWFDALINYLTAAGYPTNEAAFAGWWPTVTHLVGKDILKFHAVLWFGMLQAAAEKDPMLQALHEKKQLLPSVSVHGFFTINGQKISKSLGNAVDPHELIQRYGAGNEKRGMDVLRYFLLREIRFGSDGDFSEKRLAERYFADLANTLGNLVQRVVMMSINCFDDIAKIQTTPSSTFGTAWSGESGIKTLWERVGQCVNDLRLDFALDAIWLGEGVVAIKEEDGVADSGMRGSLGSGLMQANKLIEDTQPFKLPKGDPQKTAILYTLLEACRHYAWMLQPIMPETSKEMIKTLHGMSDDAEYQKEYLRVKTAFAAQQTTDNPTAIPVLAWGDFRWDADKPIPKPSPLFPRIG
ncbi:MAG: methionyl-tRNA synthetase [Candidatus Parcubacteria bacterium]|jgi:methionyl-tRNA synthetase